MKKMIQFGLLCVFGAILLTGCKNNSNPVAVTEAYIKGVAAKDDNQVPLLACPEYVSTAQDTLDSFTSVDLSLKDLACTELNSDGTNALVNCKGTLSASYNGENTDFDLSLLSYQLQKIDGDWLICGQK
jgi:hypothetical protein